MSKSFTIVKGGLYICKAGDDCHAIEGANDIYLYGPCLRKDFDISQYIRPVGGSTVTLAKAQLLRVYKKDLHKIKDKISFELYWQENAHRIINNGR